MHTHATTEHMLVYWIAECGWHAVLRDHDLNTLPFNYIKWHIIRRCLNIGEKEWRIWLLVFTFYCSQRHIRFSWWGPGLLPARHLALLFEFLKCDALWNEQRSIITEEFQRNFLHSIWHLYCQLHEEESLILTKLSKSTSSKYKQQMLKWCNQGLKN